MRIPKMIFVSSLLAMLSSATALATTSPRVCESCNDIVEGTVEEWQCLLSKLDSYVEDADIIDPTLILMTPICDTESSDGSKNWAEPDIGPGSDVGGNGEQRTSGTMRAYLLSKWQVNCLSNNIDSLAADESGAIVVFDFSSCEGDNDAE